MKTEHYKAVTIHLVEDDDIDAMSIERSLRRAKLLNPLIRSIDGIDALEKLQSGLVKKPFIILLDLNLPRMGGLDFLKKIRINDKLKDSIIFILTTSNSDEEIEEAYRNNVAGYIVKSSFNDGFSDVLSFLDHYWKVVEIPT